MKKMTIVPMGDRVLIRAEKKENTAGIIIPDNAEKEKPETGMVIAVGQGFRLQDGRTIPLTLSVGDKVIFVKYTPNEIQFEGEELLLIREDNVIARIIE